MLAQLVPTEGGKPITLKRDVIVVGRKPGLCDLIVERPSVSKLHCVLVKTDGLLFVRDLGSTNGTKVNGQRVTRGALLPGDELAFASVRFRVHLGPDPVAVSADDRTEMIPPGTLADEGLVDEADDNDEPQFDPLYANGDYGNGEYEDAEFDEAGMDAARAADRLAAAEADDGAADEEEDADAEDDQPPIVFGAEDEPEEDLAIPVGTEDTSDSDVRLLEEDSAG